MGSIKTLALKRKLAAALRSNKPVPAWVIARTSGKVRFSPARRHWRRNKLKLGGKK